ncbi:hypothetical protein BKA61DRAFT_674623 [Leptodontidium sp. MPI-SDFR-AT-0119]|nr:hypothetical protein BKA61DRAFT_674623 [Leptodontidium sp. MPI-SDFR-AT-0119]
MNVPPEILIAIAAELSAQDLSNFRLTSRQFARAGLPLIPCHGLSILDTAYDIGKILQLLQSSSIRYNLRSLRIYHAEWSPPETHGVANVRLSSDPESGITKISRPHEVSQELNHLFQSLPNLQEICISSAYNLVWDQPRKSRRLHSAIEFCPYPSNEVSHTFESVVEALSPSLLGLKSLSIHGYFSPDSIVIRNPLLLAHVQALEIKDFRLNRNELQIGQFLSYFQHIQIDLLAIIKCFEDTWIVDR